MQVVARIRAEKSVRRRMLSFVTALAVLVSGNVFWALRETGTAMTDPLAQELPDTGAIDLVEGTAPPGDSSEDWEAKIPDLDGLSLREKVACIADSQIGYVESSTDFAIDPETGVAGGSTRYGVWYGNPYGDWNAMFAYYCLHEAGAESIPVGGGCWAWSVALEEAGLLHPVKESIPERGDILLLDADQDGQADRCGILSSREETLLTIVEGDLDGTVDSSLYFVGDQRIIGYVSLAEASSGEASEEQGATEEATARMVEFHESSDLGIAVDAYAPEGAFPEGTFMTVSDVSRDEAFQVASDHHAEEAVSLDAIAVDISFYSIDGIELEPSAGVDVQITLPESQQLTGEDFSLLHVEEDGGVKEVEAEISQGSAMFTADAFSIYVMTGWGLEDKDTGTMMLNGSSENGSSDPATGQNSQSNRYICYLGEELELVGTVPRNSTNYSFWSSPNGAYSRAAGGWDTPPKDYTGDITPYLDPNDTSLKRITAKYVLGKTGEGEFHFQHDGIDETFYVDVRIPIYVNTDMGWTHMDRIHEFLEEAPNNWDGNPQFIYDENGNRRYWKNSGAGGAKYMLEDQDVITVSAVIPGDSNDTFTSNGYCTIVGDQTVEMLPNGMKRVTATVKGNVDPNDTSKKGNARVSIADQTFYMYVFGDDRGSTHADIEISDGGTYTIKETIMHPDGTKEVVTKYYDAYIADVNHCFVFDANNNILQTFLTKDYARNHEPGEAQYELTSNYIPYSMDDRRPQVDSNGGYILNGSQVRQYKDLDHAEFDVQILLKSRDGSPDITIDSMVYQMNHQSVIDAYNKCPAHSGLDFTLKADANILSLALEAEKELKNQDLTAGQFQFTLESEEASTVYCDYLFTEDNATKPKDEVDPLKYGMDFEGAYQVFTRNSNGDFLWGANVDGDAVLQEVRSDPRYQNVNSAGEVFFGVENWKAIVEKHLKTPMSITESDTEYTIPLSGEYLFKYEKVSSIHLTATNDEDGKIVFDPLYFAAPGTYTFTMKEVVPDADNRNGIAYDDMNQTITITVTDVGGELIASIKYHDDESGEDSNKPFKFTNELVLYTLPATGGTGTLPYAIGGTALIGTALLLLRRRRREEM